MFSTRIVSTDHYQAVPLRGLDVCYSEFRGCETKRVPVARVYGTTPAGQKTCLHIHGVFPYLYVPYDGTQPVDRYLRQFAGSVDKALNVAQGKAAADTQHVFKITVVSGVPFYGYHDDEQMFLKIYLYNPLMIRKLADLLLGGGIMNKSFQPYESHIPYMLQLFIDYNLYGMNMLNTAAVKFRRPKDKDGEKVTPARPGGHHDHSGSLSPELSVIDDSLLGSSTCSPTTDKHWDLENIPEDLWLSQEVERHSCCELEVDTVAADIVNRLEVGASVGSNPGLTALWEDERQRRRERGLDTQITPPGSPDRGDVPWTEAEAALQEKLQDIMQQLQPYLKVPGSLDSQAVADSAASSQQYPATPTASEVETHHTQIEESFLSDDSQDTVQLEEADEDAAPIINETSILRTVSSSQSFRAEKEDSEVTSQLLATTQDRALAQMLASLAEDDSPASSQAASQLASQITALEEQDSVLSQASLEGRGEQGEGEEQGEKEAEMDETLEMSQRVWEGEVEEGDSASGGKDMQPGPSAADFNLEGMDQSWTSSQWQTTDIPQYDGPIDEKVDGRVLSRIARKKRLGMQGAAKGKDSDKTVKTMQKSKMNGLKETVGDTPPAGVASSVRASPRKAALKFSVLEMLNAGGQRVGGTRKKDANANRLPPSPQPKADPKKGGKKEKPAQKAGQKPGPKPKAKAKTNLNSLPEVKKKSKSHASKEPSANRRAEGNASSDSSFRQNVDGVPVDARKFKFGKLKKYAESLERKRSSGSDRGDADSAEEDQSQTTSIGFKKQAITEIKKQWSLRKKPKADADQAEADKTGKPSRLKLKRQQLRQERRARRRESTEDKPQKKTATETAEKKPKRRVGRPPKAKTSTAKVSSPDRESPGKDRVHDNIFTSLASFGDDSQTPQDKNADDADMPILEKCTEADDLPHSEDDEDGDRAAFDSDRDGASHNFRIIRGRRGSSDSSCSDVSLTMMVGPHRKTYGPDASPRPGWKQTSDKSKYFDEVVGTQPGSGPSSRRTSTDSRPGEGSENEVTPEVRLPAKTNIQTEEEELEKFQLEVENEFGDHEPPQKTLKEKILDEQSNTAAEKVEEGTEKGEATVPSPTPPEIVPAAIETEHLPVNEPDQVELKKDVASSPQDKDGDAETVPSKEQDDEEAVVQESAETTQSETEQLPESEDFVLEVPMTPEPQPDVDKKEPGDDVTKPDSKADGGSRPTEPGDGENQAEAPQKEEQAESAAPEEAGKDTVQESTGEEATGESTAKETETPAIGGTSQSPVDNTDMADEKTEEANKSVAESAETTVDVAGQKESKAAEKEGNGMEDNTKEKVPELPEDVAEVPSTKESKDKGEETMESQDEEKDDKEDRKKTLPADGGCPKDTEKETNKPQEEQSEETDAGKLEGAGDTDKLKEVADKDDEQKKPDKEADKSDSKPADPEEPQKEHEKEPQKESEKEPQKEAEKEPQKESEKEPQKEPEKETKPQEVHPLASTIIIVRPSSPRMPVLSRIDDLDTFPAPTSAAKMPGRGSRSPKVIYPTKPGDSLSENWPGFETIAMGGRSVGDGDKGPEHSDSDSASRPIKAVSLADRKKKLSLKRQQLRENAEQRREAENGTPTDSESEQTQPTGSRRLLNAKPARDRNKFAYTLNEFGDIIVKKSKDVAKSSKQNKTLSVTTSDGGVQKIVIAKRKGQAFSFKTPVGTPIFMGSKSAVPIPASSKYKVTLPSTPTQGPIVTKVPLPPTDEKAGMTPPTTPPVKQPRKFTPKKADRPPILDQMQSFPDDVPTMPHLQQQKQSSSKEKALQQLGDITKKIDCTQSTIVTMVRRPPSPKKGPTSPKRERITPKSRSEKKPKKKFTQAKSVTASFRRPEGRVSLPYTIKPSYHNGISTKILEPKTRQLASISSHEEQYVHVLKTDCFDYDLREIGNEKLVLAKCTATDIEELKQQVKLEEKHRRTEHIMPLVLQMSDSEVEARFSGYYEQQGNFLDKLPEKELQLDSDHDKDSVKSFESMSSSKSCSSTGNSRPSKLKKSTKHLSPVKEARGDQEELEEQVSPDDQHSAVDTQGTECVESVPSDDHIEVFTEGTTTSSEHCEMYHEEGQSTEGMLHLEEVPIAIEELSTEPEEVVEIHEDSPVKISKSEVIKPLKIRLVGDDEPPILVPVSLPKIKAAPRKKSVKETHFRSRRESSRSSTGGSDRHSPEGDTDNTLQSPTPVSPGGSPIKFTQLKARTKDDLERRKSIDSESGRKSSEKDSQGSSEEKDRHSVEKVRRSTSEERDHTRKGGEKIRRGTSVEKERPAKSAEKVGRRSSGEKERPSKNVEKVGRQSSEEKERPSKSVEKVGRQSSEEKERPSKSVEKVRRRSSEEKERPSKSAEKVRRRSSEEKDRPLKSAEKVLRGSIAEKDLPVMPASHSTSESAAVRRKHFMSDHSHSASTEEPRQDPDYTDDIERAYSDPETLPSTSAESDARRRHKPSRRKSEEDKKGKKRKVIQQSDHYRFRSKRVAVDYSPSAFSHIYQMEKEKSFLMVSPESLAQLSPKDGSKEGSPVKEMAEHQRAEQVPVPRPPKQIIYRKFQGYRSMKVLVERLDMDEDDVIIVSRFLKRKRAFSLGSEGPYTDSEGDSEASSPKKLASDVPAENVDDPLWTAQRERLADLPASSNGRSTPSTDDSSQDSNKTSPKKKQLSQSKRLQTAFLKSGKRRKPKGDSAKFLNSLSALHMATVSSHKSDSTETYADEAGDDHEAPYDDVMYKMSLLSPVQSSEGEKSPARPLSPCEMNGSTSSTKSAADQSEVIDLSSSLQTVPDTASLATSNTSQELVHMEETSDSTMPSVSNRDLTSPTLDEGPPPPDLGPPEVSGEGPLNEHSGSVSPPHLCTADEEECPPLALDEPETADEMISREQGTTAKQTPETDTSTPSETQAPVAAETPADLKSVESTQEDKEQAVMDISEEEEEGDQQGTASKTETAKVGESVTQPETPTKDEAGSPEAVSPKAVEILKDATGDDGQPTAEQQQHSKPVETPETKETSDNSSAETTEDCTVPKEQTSQAKDGVDTDISKDLSDSANIDNVNISDSDKPVAVTIASEQQSEKAVPASDSEDKSPQLLEQIPDDSPRSPLDYSEAPVLEKLGHSDKHTEEKVVVQEMETDSQSPQIESAHQEPSPVEETPHKDKMDDSDVDSIQSMSPIHSPSPPQSPEMHPESEPLHTPATIPLNIEDPDIQAEVEHARRAKLAKLIGRRSTDGRDPKYVLVGKGADGKRRRIPIEHGEHSQSHVDSAIIDSRVTGPCTCGQAEHGSSVPHADNCAVMAARGDKPVGSAPSQQTAGSKEGSSSSGSGPRRSDGQSGQHPPHRYDDRDSPNSPDGSSQPMEISTPTNIVLQPVLDPPPRTQVAEEVATQGLSTVPIQEAFCSNPADIPDKPR